MLKNTLICVFATAALVLSAAAGVSSGLVHGSWWSMLPPLVAIFLALVTKEVYSSLFVGIVVGGMLASAGAQCDHVVHVSTQLPYVLLVAAVSFVSYLIAPLTSTPWISLPIAIVLMLASLLLLKFLLKRMV